MSSKVKTGFLLTIALQIIWPFYGFILSFNKVFKGHRTIAYILLAGFYGLVFVPVPESDMTRYFDQFEQIAKLDFSTILNQVKSGAFSDYYTVTLSYFVSFFCQVYFERLTSLSSNQY